MKKLLALGISLAMMASLSAVAFAAEDTVLDKGETSGTTVVKTTHDPVTDPDKPTKDETWTVTIPAAMNIAWDNVNGGRAEAIYSVDATLLGKSSVTVTVEPYGSKSLQMLSKEGKFLPATVKGSQSIKQSGSGTSMGKVITEVAAEDFNNANVGEYTGNLTFTVEYQNELHGLD